ncbi:MAG: hypothetical protein U0586_00785 [Candidatus Brocadiaceae bacterium]
MTNVTPSIKNLLNQIQELGYQYCLAGENIIFKYIKGKQIPVEAVQILKCFKERKKELIEYLRTETQVKPQENIQSQGKPYISNRGTLVTPCYCEPKYRWWAGGMSIENILNELGASEEIKKKYRFPYQDN